MNNFKNQKIIFFIILLFFIIAIIFIYNLRKKNKFSESFVICDSQKKKADSKTIFDGRSIKLYDIKLNKIPIKKNNTIYSGKIFTIKGKGTETLKYPNRANFPNANLNLKLSFGETPSNDEIDMDIDTSILDINIRQDSSGANKHLKNYVCKPQGEYSGKCCEFKINFTTHVPKDYNGIVPIYIQYSLMSKNKILLEGTEQNGGKKIIANIVVDQRFGYQKPPENNNDQNEQTKFCYNKETNNPNAVGCTGNPSLPSLLNNDSQIKNQQIQDSILGIQGEADSETSEFYEGETYYEDLPRPAKLLGTQPEICNRIVYISLSPRDPTYQNTAGSRMGIVKKTPEFKARDVSLEASPYYGDTLLYTGSAQDLFVLWKIICRDDLQDPDNIPGVYIYNLRYKAYLAYDEKLHVHLIGENHLDYKYKDGTDYAVNCLWNITARTNSTPIYTCQHVVSKKYLKTTKPQKYDDFFIIKTSQVIRLGELYCQSSPDDLTKTGVWFIVPVEPKLIKNIPHNSAIDKCIENGLTLANEKEITAIGKLGGIEDTKNIWINDMQVDVSGMQQCANNCHNKCIKSVTKKCQKLSGSKKAFKKCVKDGTNKICNPGCSPYSGEGQESYFQKASQIDIENKNIKTNKKSWTNTLNMGIMKNCNHKRNLGTAACLQTGEHGSILPYENAPSWTKELPIDNTISKPKSL